MNSHGATFPSHGAWRAAVEKFGHLLVSSVIVFFQGIVLATIVYESSAVHCFHAWDCREGEFCYFHGSITSGVCMDCIYPEIWLNTYNMTRSMHVSGVTWEKYVEHQAMHCEAYDSMRHRCDHLVENRKRLSLGGLLVLIFAAFVALILVVQDLDQASEEYAVMAARGGLTPLFYILNRACAYGLPALVVGATASLIISGSFTSSNFLLDGLAVGFASNIDDLLSFFVVGEEIRERMERDIEQILNQREGRLKWKRNGLYGAVLAIILVLTVVQCEWLLEFYQRVFGIGVMVVTYTGTPVPVCDGIFLLVAYFPANIVLIVILLMAKINERNTN